MARPPLEQLTDEELMDEYRLGAPEAFDELYRRYAPRVFGFVRFKVRGEAVHDVFQEIFGKLHRYRSKYDSSLPFLPWLFTIANHAVVDELRKKQVRATSEYPLPDNVEARASTSETNVLDLLDDKMHGALSPMEKSVIGLRFNEELSFEDIAKRLQLGAPNVRKIASRALSA